MNEIDKIELRSEKVRKIIGDIPSGFVRYGISIITIVLILIGLAFLMIFKDTFLNWNENVP